MGQTKRQCPLARGVSSGKARWCDLSDRAARQPGRGGRSGRASALHLEVLVNGRRLLDLERKEAGVFQVRTVDLDHPFLEVITRDVMAHSMQDMLQPNFIKETLYNDGELSAEQKLSVERRHQEKIEADPFLSRLALARSDPESARSELSRLRQRFDTVLKEGAYRLDGLVLEDTAANPWSDWTAWEDEMESDPVRFLREECREDTDWWDEAQAIRYDLNRLLSGRVRQILAALRQLSYLGPLRCVPSRHVTSGSGSGSQLAGERRRRLGAGPAGSGGRRGSQ